MAINPNTNFTAGQVLTAAQQNRFPRGVVAFAQVTASDTFTTEETQITATTFTAVADRYYKITYIEPNVYTSSNGVVYMKIKNGSTVLQTTYVLTNPSYESNATSTVVKTFSAGSVTITGTLQAVVGGTGTASRATTYPAQIVIEDIGPA